VRLAALSLLLALALQASADPLEQKAIKFREGLMRRHLAPEGVVLYTVKLDRIEQDLERGTYPDLADTPFFTGMFAATSCLRAELTRGAERSEALADAERGIAGLELLTRVTGRPGLMARGVRRIRTPAPDEGEKRWLPGAPGFEAFRWRGDVSMDQYANGLVPAIWDCRKLFPERTRRLAVDFATRLAEDDMRLVDPDGRPTRYGDLSWRSGFGLNSIAQLTGYAAFALAAALDPGGPWAVERDRIARRQRVPARSRVTNLRVFATTNHSNDLMAWNLYRALVPLAREAGDPALADLRHGMHRAWLRVREDRNAYFALLLCRIEPESCDPDALAAARDQLSRFPLEKRKLGPPAGAAELPRRWLPGRKWQPLARDPVPIELRPASSFEWKSSPYRLEAERRPNREYTGLDYLAAFWLLRAVEPVEKARAR
jgi:hypothetical protein